MIIDYEKIKKLQNKNREKDILVIATLLTSLGTTNYITNPVINKDNLEVWK